MMLLLASKRSNDSYDALIGSGKQLLLTTTAGIIQSMNRLNMWAVIQGSLTRFLHWHWTLSLYVNFYKPYFSEQRGFQFTLIRNQEKNTVWAAVRTTPHKVLSQYKKPVKPVTSSLSICPCLRLSEHTPKNTQISVHTNSSSVVFQSESAAAIHAKLTLAISCLRHPHQTGFWFVEKRSWSRSNST